MRKAQDTAACLAMYSGRQSRWIDVEIKFVEWMRLSLETHCRPDWLSKSMLQFEPHPVTTLSHSCCSLILTNWNYESRNSNLHRRANNFRPVSFTVSAWKWVYATNLSSLQTEKREREIKQATSRGRNPQFTNNSDSATSTSELLLRQNSVTAHVHQSWARRLASDHCATWIHRPKSAVRTISRLFWRL
jgi:hypothetical protein